jgi:hypothetical protein
MTIRASVSHLLDKRFVERSSTLLLLGIFWSSLARDGLLVFRLVTSRGSDLVFSWFGCARATLISPL